MSNTIKYSESTEQRALNKGNWWIGTGDSNKGPSDVTGFYAGVTPPSSGYTIYIKREDNLPSIFVAQNDQELINLTNLITESDFSTVQQCLVYYQTQDDKLCVNREMENIVTEGLVLNLDAGYVPSYPTSGTTWYDLSGNGNNGTLINGPTFSSGSIVFDGADDNGQINNTGLSAAEDCTLEVWAKSDNYVTQSGILANKSYYSTGEGVAIGNISNPQRLGFTIRTDSEVKIVFFNYTSTYGWSHFVGVKGSDEVRTYTNGVLINTQTYSGSITTDNDNLSIGRYLGYGRYWDGNLAIVRVYNRSITETEVLQNYNAQKGRFGL